MAKGTRPARQWFKQDGRLFTLEVCIISGPMTEAFAKKNPVVSRTIQIRGAQSLEILHHAIFGALEREEEHMYEFQVGGKGHMDPKARRYVLPMAMKDPFADSQPVGCVTHTPIGSLGLKKGDAFGYWFDFGDDWWHQINVAGIEDKVRHGIFPRVIKRVGQSPPQYADVEEEE